MQVVVLALQVVGGLFGAVVGVLVEGDVRAELEVLVFEAVDVVAEAVGFGGDVG